MTALGISDVTLTRFAWLALVALVFPIELFGRTTLLDLRLLIEADGFQYLLPKGQGLGFGRLTASSAATAVVVIVTAVVVSSFAIPLGIVAITVAVSVAVAVSIAIAIPGIRG